MTEYESSKLNAKFYHDEVPLVELARQRGQFRLSRQCGYHLGHSRYYLVEIGPGLFPGECHVVDLEVMSDHKVSIFQQSATKVMPTVGGNCAKVDSTFEIKCDSSLLYFAEPVIMLPNSAFSSEITIHLAHSSKAVFTEIIGEPPTFPTKYGFPEFLSSQLRIFRGGLLEYCDAVIVERTPLFGAKESWERVFGEASTFGTCYLAGYSNEQIETATASIADTSIFGPELLVTHCAPVPNLSVVRVSSPRAEAIKRYFSHLATLLVENDDLALSSRAVEASGR